MKKQAPAETHVSRCFFINWNVYKRKISEVGLLMEMSGTFLNVGG